ncbi:ABC-type multidrug transport system, ATPase and permease component [Streptococcus henryi]|uniref:ABC-type multidrug transport system, ATPase and permease component n=1 Tax=Streptococcus henryi TaxID=439219 RepID=A0A1G6BFD7_9STRE|nr:ABC transporter ATP-binding protein [Streptococcus henryi]SDB19335.1 ABC-type multidrug transport system, ATPase and permease component [Streptococcus henryi]
MLKLLRYLDRKTACLIIVGNLANSFVMLGQPIILSNALNLEKTTLSYSSILQFTLYGFFVYLAIYGLMLFSNHSMNVYRREININMRNVLFRKLLMSTKYTNDEKVSILTQDMEFVNDDFIEAWSLVLQDSFIVFVTAVYIIFQNTRLGLLFVIFTIMRPIPQFLMNQNLQHSGDEFSKQRTEFHAQLTDSFNGSQVLWSNQAVSNQYNRISRKNVLYQKSIQKFCFTQNLIYFFNGFMVFFSQVLPLAFGFYLSFNHQPISVANLIAMYVAATQLVSPVQSLMYSTSKIQGSKPTMSKIFEILDEVDDCIVAKHKTIDNIESLEIRDISKSYNKKLLFHHLTLKVKARQKVLLKGPSGSGKSTLFRLISGLEQADSGRIFIKAGSIEFDDFHGNVGIISQSPFLFNDMIRFNLTLGQKFSDEELISVLNQVGLVKEFNDNILEVQVLNNGENISGGQKVRLEIARFLLRKKDILLADEITAPLDSTNARAVRRLLLNLPIIVIEIAHHIDETIDYDQILDFSNLN